ncbi:MAG: BspA family leucine-rich repeat surface protein [Dyadobacter sp.]|uniref:BspA family leucine-rich repeat surface protein n=1 Tax=Dyadobacter sp. TaxID=1914288 RepID=UPI001B06A625|nr:BspA family leucine-rich repeat surface protein [Dyadobacter sp.]MBO9616423.1 BspA family leucine-rich repeat surface protein [Dyadobacter sp.]
MANIYPTAKFYSFITQLLMIFLGALADIESQAQITASDYVTTWKTDIQGDGTANTQIKIPAFGEYTVYYESIPAGLAGTLPAAGTFTDQNVITLPAAGIYRIAIRPTGAVPFHRITAHTGSYPKLLTIEQWGSVVWSSMESAYTGCVNLTAISATDAPILSSVTTMQRAFLGCSSLSNAPAMNNWDVGEVTDMASMFNGAQLFNQPIGSWDVSKVTDMNSMFAGTLAFNQPVANWNTKNVTDMAFMFTNSAFNQPIGSWNVGSVTDMGHMFDGAKNFNQPIGNWDVSSVTDMTQMFIQAHAFNQPIGNWNVGNVTRMNAMFNNTPFNQPIGDWDVSNVTGMASMFAFNPVFNQPLADWDVSSVTNMSGMFGVSAFNQPIGNWNVSSATDIGAMFYANQVFNQPIGDWDVSNVTDMSSMFKNASAFNQPLGNLTLNDSVDMSGMLIGSGLDCTNYSNTLIGWAANPATPFGLALEADEKTYGQTAELARGYLTATKSWTITGDSLDATCTSMPVTLVSFAASRQESFSLLTWSTTEETNSDRFDIQRSIDGKIWQVIGSIPSTGESKVLKKYHFEDRSPANGVNYYRLKMVDHDETFAYSHIERADFEKPADFYVYPNPASDKLIIHNYRKVKAVSMYDASGVNVLKRENLTAQGIEVSKLLPGLYNVLVTLYTGVQYTGKVQVLK